jgi:hypothetical protein
LLTALFSEVDAQMGASPPPPEALLWPREVVPWGLLQALKGGGKRPCSRWVTRASRALVPRLPEPPRLCRLLQPHPAWTQGCWAAPTVRGGIDP